MKYSVLTLEAKALIKSPTVDRIPPMNSVNRQLMLLISRLAMGPEEKKCTCFTSVFVEVISC